MLDKNALNMNNLKQTLLYDTKYMAEKRSKAATTKSEYS